MHVLATKNLTKRFNGIRAVDDLSIEVEKGKVTSVIGPNGSGKTTLTNVLSGMLPFENGTICVDSACLKKLKPHDSFLYGITRTFQEVRLFEQMTVLDNLLVVLTDRNVFNGLFEKHSKFHLGRAEELLKKVGLWEKKSALGRELSYGQRKLLEIARALAVKADIYLLDEPFAGLFPEMRKIIVTVIKELRSEGKTVVLIEHNMDIIRELSDHVIVMDSGQLLAEGEAEDVLKKRSVIEAYLGE
jgi:branched-chain amino acid transport system ATP-binding protein